MAFITFTASTLIKSSDVNSNFAQCASDGNASWSGRLTIGASNIVVFDASSNADLLLNAPNVGGGHKIKLQVGGVVVASWDSSGNAVFKGSLTQNGTP